MKQKVERHYESAEWARISYHLEQKGYILLGEHYSSSFEEFETLLTSWNINSSQYIFGQSPRKKLSSSIYTATEYPATEAIPLHQELSYSTHAPRYLFFYCRTPAQVGGETPLLDCSWLLNEAPSHLIQPFLDKGLRYHKNMPYRGGIGKTWPAHFETNDRLVVEQYLTKNNIQFQWNKDESLSTQHYQKATRTHPDLQQKVWFAQPSLWHISHLGERGTFLQQRFPTAKLPIHVTYGNGEEIPQQNIERLRSWKLENAVFFQWRSNDLLIIDNWRIAHGRTPFAGQRDHWVAMGSSTA